MRGPFTAEVLEEVNIRNIQIIRCPFCVDGKGDPSFASAISLSRSRRSRFNGSRDVVRHFFDAGRMRGRSPLDLRGDPLR